jgi:mannose-6-phosphate isomerase-like protein (cupin superfamily)
LSLKEFHRKLTDIFGNKALSYYSLCRIEKGYRENLRLKSLYQISTGLGISMKELKKDTEEEGSRIVHIIRKKEHKHNRYIYGPDAFADILSARELPFLVMEYTLLPAAVTKMEQDPIDTPEFQKFFFVLKGKVSIKVGEEEHTLSKGDTISFRSKIPHSIGNISKKGKARILMIQNPKSY